MLVISVFSFLTGLNKLHQFLVIVGDVLDDIS